jgi:hypothetical protein
MECLPVKTLLAPLNASRANRRAATCPRFFAIMDQDILWRSTAEDNR